MGRGLIKPFWYGSIFATPEGRVVDTPDMVESMIVRGGLAVEGVTAAEAKEMRQAIADCRRVDLVCVGATRRYPLLCLAYYRV